MPTVSVGAFAHQLVRLGAFGSFLPALALTRAITEAQGSSTGGGSFLL